MIDTENEHQPEEQMPRFGRLLFVCLLAIVFCGLLVWFANTYLSDCCSFEWSNRLFH
jgi:TRAP-type C4-dicarboxylate transport system permease small subunit